MNGLLAVEDDLETLVFNLVMMKNDMRENEDDKHGYNLQKRAEYASRNCELSGQRIKDKLQNCICELDKYLTTRKE